MNIRNTLDGRSNKKQAIVKSQQHSSLPTEMPTFFDYLPEDVHDSLARHLLYTVECGRSNKHFPIQDDKYLSTLLCYAKNSPAQKKSVMTAMNHCLQAHGWRQQTIVDWISTFANTLREIRLLTTTNIVLSGSLPCLPQLRKAIINAKHISLVRHTPNIQELEVKLDDSRLLSQLISCIRSLPLKCLQICFTVMTCKRYLTRVEAAGLRDACPALEHLVLRGFLKVTASVWELIAGLQALKRLGIRTFDIRECHIPFLEKMSEIEIHEPRALHLEKIRCLGGRITSISEFMYAYDDAVQGLASFPNLRLLSIFPHPGAERALAGVIDNLEELSLGWQWLRLHYAEYPDIQRLSNSYHVHPVLYQPDGEVLQKIVRSTKRLRSLKFECAILRTEVLEKVLEIVGEKLETLHVPADWQNEHTALRMRRILELVAKLCPQLTSLRFSEAGIDYPVPILATCEQKQACMQALKDLMWANPRFSSVSHVRYFVECRFTETGPKDRLIWDDIVPLAALEA